MEYCRIICECGGVLPLVEIWPLVEYGHSLHTGLMNAFCSTNLLTNSCDHISTKGKVPPHSHINLQHPTIPLFDLTKARANARNVSFLNLSRR